MKGRLVLVLLVASLTLGGLGCNPFAPLLFTAYLTGADMEQRIAFKFPEDAKRIALVCQAPYSSKVDLGHLDRDLNDKVSVKIFEYFETKKVTSKREVVKASRVHKWQNEHPNWLNLDPGEVGRALRVDYLIQAEIANLSIYEENSNRTLYKGHAEMTVKVYRVTPESHELVYTHPMIVVDCPTKDRPIPVDNISFQRFRDEFVDHMAKRLAWVFVPHETGDKFDRAPF